MEEDTGKINRRDFIRRSALVAGGFVLAACEPSKPPTIPPAVLGTEIPPTTPPAVFGTATPSLEEFVPGKYGDLIIDHKLRPVAFKETDTGELRIEAAMAYLRNLRDFLKGDGKTFDTDLKDFGLFNVFPIALSTDAKLSTLLDVIDFDVKNGKTKFKIDPAFPLAGSLTESHEFDATTNQWKRSPSVIIFNEDFLMSKAPYLEPNGKTYAGPSTLDLALIILYEEARLLREDIEISTLHNSNNLPIPSSVTPVNEEMKRKVTTLISDEHVRFQNLYRKRLNTTKQPDVAQGVYLQCVTLRQISTINATLSHMPGARLLDPVPSVVAEIQKKDPKFINLYELFFDKKKFSILRADNRVWLDKAGGP